MDARQKQINQYRSSPKGYYHLCTDGKKGLLFHTKEQYAFTMCSIALITLKFKVKVYACEVMPTHIHILLSGTGEQCVECYQFIIARIRKKLKEDGYPLPPDDYWFKLRYVGDTESFKKLVVYLARNKYETGDCTPMGHLWGTGYLLYNQFASLITGTKVSKMSARKIASITGTTMTLPPDWEIHPVLGILPRCFITTDKVYELFPTAKDYVTAMVKDYESFVKIAASVEEEISFSPGEARDIVDDLSQNLFPSVRYNDLTPEQKGMIAVKANALYGLSANLLAQALYIPEHVILQLINSKDYGKR